MNYSELQNINDLRVVPTTEENQSFLVDKKLIDLLIGQLVPSKFSDIKDHVKHVVDESNNMTEMIEKVEETFYIYKVIELMKPEVDLDKSNPNIKTAADDAVSYETTA